MENLPFWLRLSDDHVEASSNRSQWRGLLYSSGGKGYWNALLPEDLPLSGVRFADFDGDGQDDILRIDSRGHWLYWLTTTPKRGESDWLDLGVRVAGKRPADLAFGDFGGDGRADIFYTAGSQWKMSPGGTGPWQNLAGGGVPFSELRFGDFDGDGKTDVLSVFDGEWRYSSAAQTQWMPLRSSGHPLSSFAFADIDGDGKADVVYSGHP